MFETLLLYSLWSAGISALWEYLLRDGEIFGWVGWKFEKIWIGKPLGICVFCNNVWVSIIFALVLLNSYDWQIALSVIPLSHLILRMLK